MNLGLLIPVIVLTPCAAFGLYLLPRMWAERGPGPAPTTRRPRRWSFRAARQEGYARSLPASVFALTALVLAMAAEVVNQASGGTLSAVAGRIALWAFIAFGTLTLLAMSVVLFNVPKILVPPVSRDEPGAVALWWRSRRNG
jgi:hypothetical protein